MKVTQKTLDNQYAGPDKHVSLDRTTNPQPVDNYKPTGDAAEYPKYLYHKDKGAVLVNSKEEHDDLGEGHQDTPFDEGEEQVPFGADKSDLESMSRSDLAAYGNLNYGLALSGTQSRDSLLNAIAEAAGGKKAEEQPEESQNPTEATAVAEGSEG